MKKSLLALTALAATGLLTLAGCGGGTTSSSSSSAPASSSSSQAAGSSSTSTGVQPNGHHFNVRVWNDEFQNRFKAYSTMFDHVDGDGNYVLKDGTTLVWSLVANKDNKYQNELDKAIAAQDTAAANDKIDMFLVEADYALKYSAQDIALDVKGDIGLTDEDLAQQYQYTKDILTYDNKIKGVSWQATPGLYAYRTDIADAVLGTHDPDAVQAKLADWDKFNAVAAEMKEKNYHMLAGKDDSYRTYSNNVTSKWATEDDEGTPTIHLDNNIRKWVKDTKNYADKGYLAGLSDDYALWGTEWGNQQSKKGSTFGFFWSTWGINFSLQGYADPDKAGKATDDNLWGKYRVCYGPQSYYWGGTWMIGAKGTDDTALIKQTMKDLTVDPTIMKKITTDTQDYTNNKKAMKEIADSDYKSDFLGGQNHIKLFTEAADKISLKYISPYDQGCNEKFQEAMKDYFAGSKTYAEAISNFKTLLKGVYANAIFDTSFDTAI